MTKTMLLVTIGAAVLLVAAVGAITPTVIVNDGRDDVRMAQLTPAPAPGREMQPYGHMRGQGKRGFGPRSGQLPGMQGMSGLRDCLEQHGLGDPGTRGAAPDLRTMRDALKACRGTMPGMPHGR
jgi:hypothetical protein